MYNNGLLFVMKPLARFIKFLGTFFSLRSKALATVEI